MGAKWLVAAIGGDVLDRLDTVLEVFGQRRSGALRTTQLWDEASAFAYNGKSPGNPLAACVAKKWTVLLEPHGYLSGEVFEQEERSQQLARALKARVFATYTHGVTCTYAYRLFDGQQTRSVWVGDGRVEELGPKIPGEPAIDEESYNEDSLLDVMDLLGLDIQDAVEQAGRYVLLTIESSTGNASVPVADRSRPWWKFW
jgi:hypothetical protein